MIQITPQMRVWVVIEPVDFRKGMDGLAQVVRERLERDPFSGAVFVFRNRRRTALRVLVYDGSGLWLNETRCARSRAARSAWDAVATSSSSGRRT